MKKELDLKLATRLINTGSVVLVSTGDDDKKNICPIAWITPISKDPCYLGIAVAKKHYTSELIMVSEEFTINVPTWDIIEKVKVCGAQSGREIDKFKESGLTAEDAVKLNETPRIKECIASIECELYQTIDLGDHNLFIGSPVWIEAEEDCFTDDCWDTSKAKLLFHLGGKYYCKSGERTNLE